VEVTDAREAPAGGTQVGAGRGERERVARGSSVGATVEVIDAREALWEARRCRRS
jgi:hypothetical protein